MSYNSNSVFSWKFIVIVVLLTIIGMVASVVSIAGAAEPLPERPIVPITTPHIGSKIVLKAPATTLAKNGPLYDSDDWTVVQWQALDGTWFDVEGWQGTFSYSAQGDVDVWYLEWWVDSKNYGEENFRFIIYTNESRDVLKGLSPVFDLPSKKGQTVEVAVE